MSPRSSVPGSVTGIVTGSVTGIVTGIETGIETGIVTGIVTGIDSVTVEVTDQDRALAFYRDVLGCEVRTDMEVWPGARFVEVVPPGSPVAVALLTRASGLPLGVRYHTADADAAHAALAAASCPPDWEVLHLEGAPPMFTVGDPDGNRVVLLEQRA